MLEKTIAIGLLSVLMAPLSFATDIQLLEDFDQLRWQHRILIIKPHHHQEDLIQLLHEHKQGIDERDLLWFTLIEGEVRTNAEMQHSVGFVISLSVQMDSVPANIVLIGKDGTPKYQTHQLDVQEVFTTIDSMPMRKREMASKL